MNPECEYTFIYKTVRAYKELEDFFQEGLRTRNNYDEAENEEGYLIDKKYINYWKKFTDYETIKDDIEQKNYRDAKRIIIRHRKNNHLKQYQPDATQLEFYTPFSLYKSIKMKGNQYVLVNKDFWRLICSDGGIQEKGIMNYILEDNRIIFIFGPRGKLEVETDNNVLRDNKEMFIKNANNFDEEYNDNEEEDYNLLEMKKLILLYAYEQEIKNKINNLKYRENTFKEYFLISKEWIDEYKRYYHYNELCSLINHKQEVRGLLNQGYDHAKKYIEYTLAKICMIRKKPKESFPENLKIENTFLSEGNRVQINNNEVTYWKNFELVNQELKNLFANSQANEYDIEGASSAKGLISGGKFIIDLSNDQNNEGNYALEIGFIGNNDMIFVDEYIFVYDNEEAKNNHLYFFKDRFYLFQKDELSFNINLKCDLISDEGIVYGTAFKIPPHD